MLIVVLPADPFAMTAKRAFVDFTRFHTSPMFVLFSFFIPEHALSDMRLLSARRWWSSRVVGQKGCIRWILTAKNGGRRFGQARIEIIFNLYARLFIIATTMLSRLTFNCSCLVVQSQVISQCIP
ncbi:hypothetical protein M8818_002697 [Zalaria obscura]|uniref:Uncharacterized protein n=1 Tax=Zalaria obscura TaxID=2024903 RepID=A0ACC3SGN7_9PEZI